ncbi:MAG: phage major capsid protein [Gemmataceae bacterium]|nr:phage major capsid protein [Gemmataceae bacterium]
MYLQQLRNQLSAALDEMEGLAKAAQAENRGLTPDELTKFADIEARVDGLKRSIAAAERMAELSEERGQATTAPVRIEVTREDGCDEHGNCKVWRSQGEQLLAIAHSSMFPHRTDAKLHKSEKIMRAATGLNESVGADGGFLLQQDFSSTILDRAYDTGILASKVNRIGISATANGLKIPGIDETSRADGSRYGGIQMFWEGEGDPYVGTKPKFRNVELVLKKLTGLAYATEELLADAAVLEQWFGQKFSEEMGFKLDDAILNGDGAGKPQGILQAGALVTQAKESGQTNGTLLLANIIKMRARMPARSRRTAAWFYNQDVEPQLLQLNLAVGNNAYPVWMPNMNVAGEPFDVLYGRPAFAIEQANTLGAVGDVTFLDLSQYQVIDKGAMQSAQSVHVRFLNDERVFKFTYRVDGAPLWHSALTPFKGTATQSPFVTLQAR